MNRVLKYVLKTEDHQVVTLPAFSVILSVCNQQENIVLYVNASDSDKTKDIDIYIHGTGHPVNQEASLFLGTVMLFDGCMVFHVFANANQFFCAEAAQTKQIIP